MMVKRHALEPFNQWKNYIHGSVTMRQARLRAIIRYIIDKWRGEISCFLGIR